MRVLLVGLLVAWAASPVLAQTRPSTPVPTQRGVNGPFGSDWARPYPETGGYFYNDPRLQNPYNSNQPLRPAQPIVCPPGRIRNLTTGGCN